MNNQKLEDSFLSILLLKEISKSKAEVYRDREPIEIYIGNNITGAEDNILKRIERFTAIGLLEKTESEIFDSFVTTANGNKKLDEYRFI